LSRRPSSQASTPPVPRTLLRCLLVFALALVAYSNTLRNGFVFDDRILIERNPQLRSAEGMGQLFVSPYWTGEGRTNRLYRPLTAFSFALNYRLGDSPFGFHLINALLHGCVSVLGLLLVLRLFGHPGMASLAAALFAVHPVQSESVAGLVGRAEILSALFVVGALLLDRQVTPRRGVTRVASMLLFFLALLSKENALAYPALLIGTDLLLGRPRGLSARSRRGEYLVVAGVAAIYLALRLKILGVLMEPSRIPRVDNLLAHSPAGTRVLTALSLCARYLGLFLFPRQLSADYSARQIEPVSGMGDPGVWLGMLVVLGFVLVIAGLRRRLAPLSWGLGFAAASFVLVSNLLFPIGTIFAERLLYLPLLGLGTAAAFLASIAADKRPRTTAAAAAAMLVLLGSRTWLRNRDWRDDFSLFSAAARVSPRSARVRYNLGNAFRRRGDLAAAEDNYRASLALYPGFEAAKKNLGVVLIDRGRGEEAADLFRQALARSPADVSLHNNLGNAYRSLGRNAEAEAEYLRALELNPDSADSHNNFGTILHERGDWPRAESEYRTAARLDPARDSFRINLGNLLLQRGEASRAESAFREAAARNPSLAPARRGLGEALLAEGRTEEAERELSLSLKLDPGQWEAPALLGYLHQRRGDSERAIDFYMRSLARKPDQVELHQNLGMLYATRPGSRRQALEHLRRCLALSPPPAVEAQVKKLVEELEKREESAP
jgi:Flp pilus assembly protein TadD